jgi:hypothetical protein
MRIQGIFTAFNIRINNYRNGGPKTKRESTEEISHCSFNIGPVMTPDSSVSIVSGYGLDDRAIEVRSPAEIKDFSSSLCVHTGSAANAASCTIGTEGPFSGAKARPGRDANHSPPSYAEVENE